MVVTANTSKQIRENLKSAGYGSRDVSVRNHSYSMGSSVRVRILRAEVALNEVHRIAIQSEQVRRDESGDILEGGNTFVDVAYEHGALDAVTDRAQAAIDAGQETFGEFSISEDPVDVDTAHVWRTDADGVGTHILRLSRTHGAAAGLARLLATHGRLALLDAYTLIAEDQPPPSVTDVAELARAWQQAYPCPEDCAELAALWNAVAALHP